jgi:hypothetical protein
MFPTQIAGQIKKGKFMLALRYSLASVWLLTALASLAWPQADSLALLAHTGLTGHAALTALHAGIAVDLLMGILTLLKPGKWQRWLWPTQAIIILTYTVIILIYLPELALHPFGMLIKNIPIFAILWVLWRNETREKPYAV